MPIVSVKISCDGMHIMMIRPRYDDGTDFKPDSPLGTPIH